ncbi:charged multivesicular body protein 3 isoform X1 [Oncorhynchus masou masou]|uniref:Charged multivesicular body protein 3 n=1 Tax=Oncorhynchus mykiss TaxID=8022 RepID=A0A8C7RB39_ONCMY
MGLFGKTHDKPPKDLVNEWSLKIRKEMRVIDRQIRDIQREEEKVKRSIKDAAKKGHRDVCVVLAKEMIQSKRAVSKLYASKAQMNSVLLSMKNQLSVLRVAGALQKSTEVMKAMQSLVKIPEIQGTMRELSKEMMKLSQGLRDAVQFRLVSSRRCWRIPLKAWRMTMRWRRQQRRKLIRSSLRSQQVPLAKRPAKSQTPCLKWSLLPQLQPQRMSRRRTLRRCILDWQP